MMLRLLLALLLLMLTWPGSAGGAYADQFSMSGVNLPGSDIRSFDIPRPDGGFVTVESICRQTCENDGQCKAWTLVKAGLQGPQAKCWLKSAIPARRADPCCTSGVPERRTETSVNRAGADYDHVNVSNPAFCRDLCQRGGGQCAAWTFVRPGVQGPSGVCWLKSAVPDATSDNCCTSGVMAGQFVAPK